MRYEIIHESQYKYSDRIFLDPHIIRLVPRSGMYREVRENDIIVDPVPEGLNEIFDLNGNRAFCAWFSDMTDYLTIRVRSVLEISEENPFNFIAHPSTALRLPMEYEPADLASLQTALNTRHISHPELTRFALDLATESQWDTLKFLMGLCRSVHEKFTYAPRLRGDAHEALQTLQTGRGSCRDFAIFAASICRAVGLAPRVVSGYLLHDDLNVPIDLHAWFEVYIPSAGWKGFDPTHGLMCYQNHIPLANGYDMPSVAPIAGNFRGFANAHMSHTVEVRTAKPVASGVLA